MARKVKDDASGEQFLEVIESLKTPVSIVTRYRIFESVPPDIADRLKSCRREISIAIQAAADQYGVLITDIISYHQNSTEARRFIQHILYEIYNIPSKEIARFFERTDIQIAKDRSMARSTLRKDEQAKIRFDLLRARIERALGNNSKQDAPEEDLVGSGRV